ncbi:MAG: hypothetical protein IJH21_05135 [Oscillospiraceae bacterium]|nr:hypothetical protein [Oscillospiraceae bacterium]
MPDSFLSSSFGRLLPRPLCAAFLSVSLSPSLLLIPSPACSCSHLALPHRLLQLPSEDYSKEELVAEVGAAILMNEVGIETKGSFRNSAGYIQNWLTALRNDSRMIVSAAGKAEKAVKLIMNMEDTKEVPAAA